MDDEQRRQREEMHDKEDRYNNAKAMWAKKQFMGGDGN